MLDTKGITLEEVNEKYPRVSQVLGYDVLMDVDEFHKPKVISTFEMCCNAIVTLLMMKPGQYPSIPELGIDIEQYLFEYSDDKSIPVKVKNQIMDQCNRLELTGIDVNVYFNNTYPSCNELRVEITGTDYITNNHDMPPVIIGITYDKLNRLYIHRYQDNS